MQADALGKPTVQRLARLFHHPDHDLAAGCIIVHFSDDDLQPPPIEEQHPPPLTQALGFGAALIVEAQRFRWIYLARIERLVRHERQAVTALIAKKGHPLGKLKHPPPWRIR